VRPVELLILQGFEGSAELIAAAFISAPSAELVAHASTKPMKMHFAG
jgi:hypothetical protein